MSTYDTTRGPSTPLAYLRTLFLRNRRPEHTSRSGPSHQLAETALELLASDHGYSTVTTAATGAVSLLWTATGLLVRGIGGTLVRIGRAATAIAGRVAPALAQRMSARLDSTAATVTRAWRHAHTSIRRTAAALAEALHRPMVRRCVTASAQAATLWLLLAAMTDGALPALLVAAAPWTMGAVVASLNPTTALAAVAVVGTAALLIALARAAADDHPDRPTPPAPVAPSQPAATPRTARRWAPDPDREPSPPDPVTIDVDDIARTVRVEINTDGSVTVHGIPDTVPPDIGQVLAEAAQHEAERHLQRILRIRRVPTRNDRRVVTKAAREAVATAVRRLSTGQQNAA